MGSEPKVLFVGHWTSFFRTFFERMLSPLNFLIYNCFIISNTYSFRFYKFCMLVIVSLILLSLFKFFDQVNPHFFKLFGTF